MAELATSLRRDAGDRQRALDAAIAPDRARLRQGLGDAAGPARPRGRDRDGLDRLARASTSRSGVGGLPRGRIVEIYGPESSGKTTLTLHVIAEAQKAGGACAFIDAEHALDPGYARKLGVNLDELLISQPDTGEQALEIADTLVRSVAIDVIVDRHRWRRWCPRPSSRARWATACRACRRG